jgi:hypothetical protein
MKKWALLAILFVLQGSNSFANNILVNNISLVKRNATSDIVFVKFDLSWQNSFKTSSGAANYDAAWVFVKYRIGDTGEWKHATLNNGAHTIPSGTSTTQSDGTGLFLYRNNDGNGTFSMTDIELRWNYGADGVADESKIFVKVFAIEMVYIPEGSFQLGSTGQNTGEFRQANDISSTGSSPLPYREIMLLHLLTIYRPGMELNLTRARRPILLRLPVDFQPAMGLCMP